MTFRTRVILGIAAIQVVVLSLLLAASVHSVRSSNMESLRTHTDATTDLFSLLVLDAVLTSDLARLEELTKGLVRQPSLSFIRVLSIDGQVLSAVSSESLNTSSSIMMGSSAIHVADKVFGQVELGVSTMAVDVAVQGVVETFLIIGGVGLLLTVVFSYMMGGLLGQRLTVLEDGTDRVAQGELGYQIAHTSDDELGRVARSFNRMSEQLKEIYDALDASNVRFKAISNSIPGAVYQRIVHPDGTSQLTYMSEGVEKLYGVSADSLLEDPDLMARIICEEDRDLFFNAMRRSIANKAPLHVEVRIDTPDGLHKWIRAEASLSIRADGAAVFDGMVLDVTKDRELDRIKSEFVSVVNHELRTPLTSIQGSLGLISHAPDGSIVPKYRRMVDIANRNCTRLVRLVNDILDMEKIASGNMPLNLAPVAVDHLLEDAIEATHPFAEFLGKSVVVVHSLPGVTLSVDADRIVQVLTNLISNAVKFELEGGTVHLAATTWGKAIRFSVTDHGEGIPHAFRGRVFEKFAQAETALTRSHQGTGLGLAISKTLIEAHGGQIDFTTKFGETTFWFDIPLDAGNRDRV